MAKKPQVTKHIRVQRLNAMLLKGDMTIKFYPTFKKFLDVPLTTQVVFSHLYFLILNPTKSNGGFASFSYTKLRDNHFPFLSRITVIREIKTLVTLGAITISNTTGGINRYNLTESVAKPIIKTLTGKVNDDDTLFITVFPELAKKTSLIESIILQRLHYRSMSGNPLTYTFKELKEYLFDFIPFRSIERGVASLVSKNLLEKSREGYSGSNTYSLNYDELEKLFPLSIKIIQQC